MRYFDCFLYNGEKECLQIRQEELKPLGVDHVIVQSFKTFTGNDKNITFFAPYNMSNKIPIDLWGLPENLDAWGREAYQRNQIMQGLTSAKDDDIVIISDADEIPKLEAIKSYKHEMGLTALRMDVFWYKFNCLAEKQTWLHPRICSYGYLKNTTPQKVRESGYDSVIDNAGHHFSYLGDADFIVNKIQSFSHQEYNKGQYINKEEITRKINQGVSLWGESKFKFVPIDETFPKYLYDNKGKFKHLIV